MIDRPLMGCVSLMPHWFGARFNELIIINFSGLSKNAIGQSGLDSAKSNYRPNIYALLFYRELWKFVAIHDVKTSNCELYLWYFFCEKQTEMLVCALLAFKPTNRLFMKLFEHICISADSLIRKNIFRVTHILHTQQYNTKISSIE